LAGSAPGDGLWPAVGHRARRLARALETGRRTAHDPVDSRRSVRQAGVADPFVGEATLSSVPVVSRTRGSAVWVPRALVGLWLDESAPDESRSVGRRVSSSRVRPLRNHAPGRVTCASPSPRRSGSRSAAPPPPAAPAGPSPTGNVTIADEAGSGRRQDRRAHLRFAVIGTLLAAPADSRAVQSSSQHGRPSVRGGVTTDATNHAARSEPTSRRAALRSATLRRFRAFLPVSCTPGPSETVRVRRQPPCPPGLSRVRLQRL
jgi:hypothetical protein